MAEVMVTNVHVFDNATGAAVAGINGATGALDQTRLAVTGQGQGLTRTGSYSVTMDARSGSLSYDRCKWISNDGTYDQFVVGTSKPVGG